MIRQGERGRWIADIAGTECVYQTKEDAINAEQQYIQYLREENRRLKNQLGEMK